jgi:NADH dehydrogenase FAD-containing subunit
MVRLETPEQAAHFNRRLLDAFLRAQTQPGPLRPGQLHVAIVGAGATGTELAPLNIDALRGGHRVSGRAIPEGATP